MNPERLLQHFDRISEAPDAIPRLRRFILDLAVRGKLVEQDPNDGPAVELLKRIQAEKAYLVKEGKVRKQQPLTVVTASEYPFRLPDNWQWVHLIDIVTKLTDGTHHSPPNGPDGAFKYITAKNIKPEGVSLVDVTYVSADIHNEIFSRCNPEKDDLLYIKDGATTGIVTLNNISEPFSMLSSVALLKLPTCLSNKLLVTFLRSPFFYDQMRDNMKGAAITRVTLKRMEPALVPLPPLAEQHRIVAKVDELMALCDQLEAAKTEREQSRNRLVVASLHRLNSPADTAETDAPDLPAQQTDAFRDHACFVFNHLPRLTTRPEHIKQLRQTILNLAMRGKLVPQNPSDEPVSSQLALNDHARKEIAQKDRRADSGLQQLLVPEEKWEVPASWEWRGVADLVLFIDYRGKTPSKEEEGIRLITAKNVRKGFISLSPEEFLAESVYRAWMTRGIPQEGDVLFTTEAPMGNAAVVRLKERFALAQRVINFRLYGALDPDFLVLQLLAEPFQSILDKTATGLTAKGIKAAKLKRLPMTIPPLAEQHRIVARVDELMALCDQLEAQITATEADSRRLLEAVLHEALVPELEETA